MSVSGDEKKATPKKRYLERIKTMRLLDDDFFTVCFQDDKACTELVLRIIMEKDDLHVLKVTTQKTVSNLQGHSVRLDAG